MEDLVDELPPSLQEAIGILLLALSARATRCPRLTSRAGDCRKAFWVGRLSVGFLLSCVAFRVAMCADMWSADFRLQRNSLLAGERHGSQGSYPPHHQSPEQIDGMSGADISYAASQAIGTPWSLRLVTHVPTRMFVRLQVLTQVYVRLPVGRVQWWAQH